MMGLEEMEGLLPGVVGLVVLAESVISVAQALPGVSFLAGIADRAV